MIAHQKATVGLATGGWPSRGSATEPQDKPPTLAEAVLSALRWCAVFQFIGFLRGIDQNLAPIGARRRQHRGDQRRPQPCGRGVDLDQLDVVTGETSINNVVNGAGVATPRPRQKMHLEAQKQRAAGGAGVATRRAFALTKFGEPKEFEIADAFVERAMGADVATVVIGGKIVVENHQPRTIDVEGLYPEPEGGARGSLGRWRRGSLQDRVRLVGRRLQIGAGTPSPCRSSSGWITPASPDAHHNRLSGRWG